MVVLVNAKLDVLKPFPGQKTLEKQGQERFSKSIFAKRSFSSVSLTFLSLSFPDMGLKLLSPLLGKTCFLELSMVAELWLRQLLWFLFSLHSMQQERPRSKSFRETFPLQDLGAPGASVALPGSFRCTDASPGLQLPQNNLGGATCEMDRGSISLQEASLGTQKLAASFPAYRVAPAQNPKEVPPPTQLELDKLELEHDGWTHRVQLRQALEAMHQAVHSLVTKLEGQQGPTRNNNDNNTNDDNNNHTNNTNNTNDNNNNKSSRESGLNSLDLDNENPESEADLDSGNLFSFNPRVGVESSLGSLYQHEAEQSFSNKGEQTMTIGFGLGSFTQEGMMLGTTWDPSLEPHDPSLSHLRDKKRPQKRVSFDEGNLAYHKLWQNTRKQGCINLCPENVQLRQLAHKKRQNNSRSYKSSLEEELPEPDTTMTTTKTCWTKLQQEHAKQQQTATTLEKSLAHRRCITTNLGSFSEEDSLGSLEQNASTTNWPAASLWIPRAQQQQQLRHRH